jgi:PIN domain nuclease of toxin-antitoxin system
VTVPLAMKVLVDTCTLLWIASASPRLSKTAAAVFLDRNNEHYPSTASAWEISIKHAAGRLPLPERPDIFIPAVHDARYSGLFLDSLQEVSNFRRSSAQRAPFGSSSCLK